MNPWINDRGCEIFFEELVAIDQDGNQTAGRSYSWWRRCGLHRDQFEQLPDCVQDARAHIEE